MNWWNPFNDDDDNDRDDDQQDSRRYIPIDDVNDPALDDSQRQSDADFWGTDDIDDDQRN